jgi:hypothetical protein
MEPNAIAKVVLEEAARRSWGATSHPHGPDRDRDAAPGSVRLDVPVPGRDAHRIEVLQRGNAIEVAYTDGLPPGPVESQFVFDPGEEREAIRAASDFVDALRSGRVTVIREPLPWWVRPFVRGATTALRFRGDG